MRLVERITIVAILAVSIAAGLSFFWKASTPDPDTEAHARESAQLVSIIKAKQAELELVTAARDSLQRIAQRSSAQADGVVAVIHFDTTLPKPHLTSTGTPSDTVAMDWVQRRGDTTHYVAPLFFTMAYETILGAWKNERRLRIFDSTYTIPYKDTLAVQLWDLTKSQAREIEDWKGKANPRCGRRCGVALGVLGSVSAAWAVNQIGKSFHAP